MLPDDLFLNLIDLELQKKIAISDDLDGNAAEALKLLLETAPTSMTGRWTEQTDGIFSSTKERITFQEISNYDEKS